MPARRVSPNRMELMRLKRELQIARRGHRLMKDKRDGMMQSFLTALQEAYRLRQEVDSCLAQATEAMSQAQAGIWPELLNTALLQSATPLTLQVEEAQIMAVSVPRYQMDLPKEEGPQAFPYGMAMTNGDMDQAIRNLRQTLPVMLRLAEAEKGVQRLAAELERTRRRVNSLEHVLIPELEQSIHEISLKLEENERDSLTRLMKVKDMIVQKNLEARRQRD